MKGVLGGTFDPPHYGHLILALEAAEIYDLEEVLLVPARFPPHKPGRRLSDYAHRLNMTRLAVSDSTRLTAADLEPREGKSWTVNLVRSLKESGMDVCFIMGMDSLEELHTWKNPRGIAEIARMVAGVRPGYDVSKANPEFASLVDTFEMPGVNISSSDLRDRFAAGKNTRYLLPEAVRNYIGEKDLYARKGS
ncbi:MAG: nicotinate (nicotinamide) nucleotide adenylyltransferase [Candidatus Aegiribacteria sp.]|nr:nicotinate (nicotinamide) nucleotide adenylyltransferase [Candidatus Aegiribacteria sp.]